MMTTGQRGGNPSGGFDVSKPVDAINGCGHKLASGTADGTAICCPRCNTCNPPPTHQWHKPLAFKVSDAGRGRYVGQGYSGPGRGPGRMQSRDHNLLAYVGGIPHNGGFPQGSFLPTMGHVGNPMGAPHGPPGGFQHGYARGPPPYRAPPVMNGGYGPTGG
jgi:hypothetical protein